VGRIHCLPTQCHDWVGSCPPCPLGSRAPDYASYGRSSDRQRKVAFSTTALTFDTTSPVNPDEYRHKPTLYRQKPQTEGYIFAADSICASPSGLKQSCLKTRASMLNDSTRETVFNAKWLLKVNQGHLFRCRWKATGILDQHPSKI